MSYPIGSKIRRYVKGRTIEDKTPVLGADEDALRHIPVGAGSVEEGNPALRVCPNEVSGIENQAADAGLDKRCNARHRKTKCVSSRYFMLVGVRAERSLAEVIAQCAARVAVIGFDTLVPGEEERVAGQNAPTIGGGLTNTLAVCLLQKCSKKLDGRFRSVFRAALLGKRG